jgi:general secretion pathway protein I
VVNRCDPAGAYLLIPETTHQSGWNIERWRARWRREPIHPLSRCESEEAGFTLVEVIVAIAILSIGLTVLMSMMSHSLRQVAQAEKIAEAGSLAQSLIAGVGTELPIREGESGGQFPNGYHWHLAMHQYGDANEREVWPVGAYTISAKITWNDGPDLRSYSLTTLRLGPKGSRQ